MTTKRSLPLVASRLPALLLALSPLGAAQARADTIPAAIQADMPGLMATYRDLHAHPELGFQEVRSAKIMADAARKAGFQVTEGVGKTGVVAVIRNGAGPTVLIRADMDGLPVTEQTGLPFASTQRATAVSGVESGLMHACGHDTHMTAWIETARLLAARKAEWSGTLVMVAQPAEEMGMGARAMLADGLYTRFPKPDYVLAFHDTPELEAGVVGVSSGWALANVDSIEITVKGVGGHGAYPHMTKDPIVVASAIVMRLQTLASREIDPLDSVVVTVGSFHAGTKHNIIPSSAKLELTVRSYSDATRAKLLAGIRRIAENEARAAGLEGDLLPEVKVGEPYTRSTWNTPEFAQGFLAAMRTRLGEKRAVSTPSVMAGEDFGEFYRADDKSIQSLIFWVGGTRPADLEASKASGKALPSLHSPFWAPDAEKVIGTAAEALTATSLRLMPKGQ